MLENGNTEKGIESGNLSFGKRVGASGAVDPFGAYRPLCRLLGLALVPLAVDDHADDDGRDGHLGAEEHLALAGMGVVADLAKGGLHALLQLGADGLDLLDDRSVT